MANDFDLAFDGANVNRTLLKNALIKRVIYPFEDGEDVTAWFANIDGTVPLAVANSSGGLFFLDPLDTTTPHDGVATLVTFDGYRYKISNMTMPDAVKNPLGLETPPSDPDIGDAYLTGSAPDGDWAANPNQFAVYTIREWLFIVPRIGRPFYVEGSGHYYLDENGDFIPTFQANDASIRDTSLIGGSRFFIVESSTLNVPPGAPGEGVYWIVGGSPTGAWAGKASQIATKYSGDADWTFFSPSTGMMAFDKAQVLLLAWTGAAWTSQAGAVISAGSTGWNVTPSTLLGGSGSYTFVAGTPATLTPSYLKDDTSKATITTQVGRRIRFLYEAVGDTRTNGYALFEGNNFSASDTIGLWDRSNTRALQLFFEVVVSSSAAVTYRVVMLQTNNNAVAAPLQSRLSWQIMTQ